MIKSSSNEVFKFKKNRESNSLFVFQFDII